MSRVQVIVDEHTRIQDLEVSRPGASPLRMLGTGGVERELAVLGPKQNEKAQPANGFLPVLVGTGMGHALGQLLTDMPELPGPDDLPLMAVVDKEVDLIEAANLDLTDPRILHINEADTAKTLAVLTHWQQQHGGLPFKAYVQPFYLRLDKDYYGLIREHLEASQRVDFWAQARQPRFRDALPRLLLITSQYFLVGEVGEACQRLGIPHRMLTLENDEMASQEFVQSLLRHVVDFKPDAVLTLNHLGVDREGVLTNLLAQLELPLASWFVDNPHLVLHLYEGLSSPWLTIFTWDKDNIPTLKAQGFTNVFHLPLGTTPERFDAKKAAWASPLRSQVSFVGNSMVFKVGKRLYRSNLPASLLRGYKQVAARFAASPERSLRQFILDDPELCPLYTALPSIEQSLHYETLITWESTRQYRTACVSQLFNVGEDIKPLIIGDEGWQISFRKEKRPWRWHAPLAYYNELPHFYPLSTINLNTTSMQMKGAVNQRVFDIPLAGAFVLTDYREQMDELLEPGKEIIFYNEPEEIPELARYYLNHPAERERVIQAGRRRVLACHTWDNRVQQMLTILKDVYG